MDDLRVSYSFNLDDIQKRSTRLKQRFKSMLINLYFTTLEVMYFKSSVELQKLDKLLKVESS